MASFANQISLFILLLITLLSSFHTHARDPQFFNKIPSTTTKNVVVPNNKEQQQQQPSFLPDNENSYGLYGHESGQLPPSATAESKQPLPKYLPKNYNPTAYVTQPEEMTPYTEDHKSYTSTTTTNPNGNYYNHHQEEEEEEEPAEYTNNGNNYNYRLGSSFNSQPQGLSDTRENYNDVNGGVNGRYYRPQGMSDTRLVENGKYFYDLNNEKFSNNHPYERLRGRNDEYNNNRNYYYANSENYMGGRGYENQVDVNNMP